MKYIEAPDQTATWPTLFVGGGISNCPDWQQEFCSYLEPLDLTVLNPRRENFPMDDPVAAPEQIIWEYKMLRKSDAISFWFPKETLCPITLYELGTWSARNKPIFIGVEPGYQRMIDIRIQTDLCRPEIDIQYNLQDLATQVQIWLEEKDELRE